jgi:hypothetical protein
MPSEINWVLSTSISSYCALGTTDLRILLLMAFIMLDIPPKPFGTSILVSSSESESTVPPLATWISSRRAF